MGLGVGGREGVGNGNATFYFITYGFVHRSICFYVSFVFNYFIFIKVLCCKFLGLPSALAKFFCQAPVDHLFLEKNPKIKIKKISRANNRCC